jgi:hypothetical protein
MTEQTLDRVARVLATGMPRRQVMKAAAAAAAGGVLTMVSRQEDPAAGGFCANGLTRCGGDGCYNPTTDICCKCPGERKGRQIIRGVLLYDPPITCSTFLSCRD